MPELRVDELSVGYGAEEVFRGVTFQLERGQRLGVVGANGSGKSSLLKVVASEQPASSGRVELAPRTRVAYLAQELESSPHGTVYEDALHSRPDIMQLRAELDRVAAHLAAEPPDMEKALERFGEAQHEYERLDGYAFDSRVAEVLSGVGLTQLEQQLPPSALSGGQRRRLALARLLLQDADLLLLDEPTNHLDLEAIEWLENFLKLSHAGMLLVSHDRRFLERLTHNILELQAGRAEWYPGNYGQYLRLRRERRALRQKEYEAQQEFISRTEEFIRRYKAGQRAREARGRQTRLDRMERVEPPAEDERIKIRLKASSTSDLVFQSEGLLVGYGDRTILKVPRFTIAAQERVAIVGPNGSGKTSLLKVLLGELRPLEGKVKTGPRVRMRYYDQHLADLNLDKTVLAEIQDAFGLPEETIRTFLGRLLFSGDDAFKRIRSLSGGEKSRVALAKLMLDDAGLLLLDEPTNHLDIPAQEMLEEALSDYAGTVVFVSHDRYFIDALATHLWLVEGGEVKMFMGNYRDFERRRARNVAQAAEPRQAPERKQRQPRTAEKAQVVDVERQIEQLETEIKQIEEELADYRTYDQPEKVSSLSAAHQQASARLQSLYEEWELAVGEPPGA